MFFGRLMWGLVTLCVTEAYGIPASRFGNNRGEGSRLDFLSVLAGFFATFAIKNLLTVKCTKGAQRTLRTSQSAPSPNRMQIPILEKCGEPKLPAEKMQFEAISLR
jgi:hypothetical protein